MSASIVVRPATVDDVPAIQAVEAAAGERFRAVDDPRIACCADAAPYAARLAALPAHGRRGVGRASFDQVVAWTVAEELVSVALTTFRDVPWNGPYYEKLGFHVVSTLTPALRALVDEQASSGLEPSLRVVMRRSLLDRTRWAIELPIGARHSRSGEHNGHRDVGSRGGTARSAPVGGQSAPVTIWFITPDTDTVPSR